MNPNSFTDERLNPGSANSQFPPYGYPMGFQQVVKPPVDPMSIVGMVLSVILPPIGLIVSIIAFRKAKRLGYRNILAQAGIIAGALLTFLAIIGIVIGVFVFGHIFAVCNELGPGVHLVDGVTYTCHTRN